LTWLLLHDNTKLWSITIKKSLNLALCSLGGATGRKHQNDLENVDDHEAEDAEIVQRTHSLPHIVQIVQTGPHRQLSEREEQVHYEQQNDGS